MSTELLHITWEDSTVTDGHDHIALIQLKFAEFFAPDPVPHYEPMMLLRAHVTELPGLSAYTTEPYELGEYRLSRFGEFLFASHGTLDEVDLQPVKAIVVKHEVRLVTTSSDERFPFKDRAELEQIVETRAREILAECQKARIEKENS